MFEEDNNMMPETNAENIEKMETVTTAENTETVNMGDSESRKALYPEQQPVYYNAQSMNDMQYQNPVQQNAADMQYQNPVQPQQNVYSTQNLAQPQQNVYSTQNPGQSQQNMYGAQYQNQPQQNTYGTQYQNQPQQNAYGTGSQYQSWQNQNSANYQNPPVYYNENQQTAEKKESQGFGIAALILGIFSLLLFCTCINIPLAILAIIFGIIQIVKYKQKGLAIGGIVTAGLSILLLIILLVTASSSSSNMYEDLYDELYEEYDFTEMETYENYGPEFL